MGFETKSEKQEEKKKEQPVSRFKHGGITLSVWKNKSEKGGEYFSFTLQRIYKKQDGSFDYTNSLRMNDLPKAILCLFEAFNEGTRDDSSEGTN